MDVLNTDSLCDLLDKYKTVMDVLFKYIPDDKKKEALAEAADIIRSERQVIHFNDEVE